MFGEAVLQPRHACVNSEQDRLHFVIAVARFMAPAVDQVRREYDKRQQLQEFRLPVLHGGGRPLPDITGGAKDVSLLTMLDLLRSESAPTSPCLERPACQEQRCQNDA